VEKETKNKRGRPKKKVPTTVPSLVKELRVKFRKVDKSLEDLDKKIVEYSSLKPKQLRKLKRLYVTTTGIIIILILCGIAAFVLGPGLTEYRYMVLEDELVKLDKAVKDLEETRKTMSSIITRTEQTDKYIFTLQIDTRINKVECLLGAASEESCTKLGFIYYDMFRRK
jgi:hypothetical protein